MSLSLSLALVLALQGAPLDASELRPGAVVADRFHPEHERIAGEEPRRGGTVRVHLASLPASLNYLLVNQASARHVLQELHEPLIEHDPESWEWRGVLAERWEVADRVVLRGPEGRPAGELVGRIERTAEGLLVHVREKEGESSRAVPASDVLAFEPGTVVTFDLRRDVRWHDGHPFDARDVVFTFECTKNPDLGVARGHRFEKLRSCEALDAWTVRFVFEHPYFLALSTFDLNLTLLPAHVFDPRDPDHPQPQPAIDAAGLARAVRESAANREWIGLGPYRLVEWGPQQLEARRFDGYFDPARAGWVDGIRWRAVSGAAALREALLAGELDYTDRLDAEAFFGDFVESDRFRERCYAARLWLPYIGYVAWNLRRPELADARVRRALASCFDWESFLADHYHGLAYRVTGEQFAGGPSYDRSLEPLPFAPEIAERLLAEAGWYDHDGDGLVDREDRPLELELLQVAGNPASEAFGVLFQESLARVGVRLRPLSLEPTTFSQRVRERDFDGASLAWSLELESDPEQLWHSRWAAGGGGNHPGLADEEVDLLIDAIQVELDDVRRAALFQRLQRRLYELQPYLFGASVARRLAIARRVRGVQLFALDPGISIRRWWLAD